MPGLLNCILNIVGRMLLVAIFFMSAVGNKIPNFAKTAGIMEQVGVPAPTFMLVGAIVFLIAGSLSILVGYQAKFGALLLFTFLVLATYFFHNFWALEGKAAHDQQIQFFKNLALMGAMLMIMANGVGVASIDACRACRTAKPGIEEK